MFSQKTLDFLFENRLRNSRSWFLEHKDEYTEYVLRPLTEMAVALTPAVSSIDDLIVTIPRVDKTISRIYRDVRFSHDKSLYREEMWLSFKRDKNAYPRYPEFFFALWPGGFSYGCGYYRASAETMETMRALIVKRDPAFARARTDYEAQQVFVMEGEMYKRSRYPDQPENIRNWLDRKNICFTAQSADISLLFSDALPQTVGERYKTLTSVYRFFTYIEERKWKNSSGC